MRKKVTSPNNTARVAGLTFLLTTAIVVYANFGINSRLMVVGNPAETAQNILAHESLFRLSIVCHIMYCAGLIILVTTLYAMLKRVNQVLAMLAAFWRLVYVFTWILVVLNFFTALRLIHRGDYLKTFDLERVQAVAKLFFNGFDQYYVGLVF